MHIRNLNVYYLLLKGTKNPFITKLLKVLNYKHAQVITTMIIL